MGKMIANIVILSAVTLSCAAAAIGIHAMVKNGSPETSNIPDGSGEGGTTSSKPVEKIEKDKSLGLLDEYIITYKDGTTSKILVINGIDGPESFQGLPDENGHVPTITVGENGNWYFDGVDQGVHADGLRPGGTAIQAGRGIVSIEKTNTYGLTDEYTITYTDETTSVFLVKNGADGIQGIQGITGPSGHTPVIEIGVNGNWFVDNVDSGVSASGLPGTAGKSAYELAVDNGYAGTLEEWLLSLVGAAGAVGPAGQNGKSAYELAVDNGYTGTEAEWLTTLIGAAGQDGQNGTNGMSAYQIYCESNIDPDLEEDAWLASLYGEDGQNGKSAYEIYVAVNPGSTLSESEWLESLVGQNGQDGRGIASIAGPETSGLFDTYTINYSDSTTSTFVVRNGADGHNGASLLTGSDDPEATDGESGDSYINTTTWEYFTKSGNAWASQGTIKGATGAAGVDGRSLYTGDGAPAIPGNGGDSYIDLSNGDYYVHSGTEWVFRVNVRGDDGDDGRGITTISLTDDTSAEAAEYTISYSDGSSSTFQIAKPRSIVSIVKTGTADLVDTYTITYSYGAASTFTVTNGADGKTIYHGEGAPDNAVGVQDDVYIDTAGCNMYFKGISEWGDAISFRGANGANGVGIESIAKTDTTGLVDTYTVTYTNSTTSTFTVTNGADGLDGTKVVSGSGAPSSMNGFQEGDAYIDTATWNYYVLAMNSVPELEWQLSGNIKGADGLDGTKLTVGDTDPSSTTGFQEGDSFLNTSTWDFFVLAQGATELEWTLEGNIHNSPNRYTVSFESNGGNAVASLDDLMEGCPVGLANKPTDPTKSGFFFEGWYTEDGSRWDFVKDVVTDEITLYAKWGQLEVTNGVLTGCTLSGDVEIPYSYDGQIISSVDADTFKGRTDLTSIVLPNSVTTIDDEAFMGCTQLTEATLPKSLTKIPNSAFQGCTKLTVVPTTSSLTEIGDDAFSDCTAIEAVVLPKTLTTIGARAFKGCSHLAYITYPDNVALTTIKANAFENCTSLQDVILPDSLTYDLRIGCFKGCTSIRFMSMVTVGYSSAKDLGLAFLFDGTSTPASLETVVIRGKSGYSASIKQAHFTGASSIKNLTIGNVYYIGQNQGALAPLTALESLTIAYLKSSSGGYLGYLFGNTSADQLNTSVPESLETVILDGHHTYNEIEISYYCFTNCSHLKRITFGPRIYGSATTGGQTFALKGCTSLEYLETSFLGTSNSATNDSYMNLSAMFGYSSYSSIPSEEMPLNLKEVVITRAMASSNNLTSLSSSAFDGWSQIEAITLPDCLTSIYSYSFRNCGVKYLDIPDSVKNLPYGDNVYTFAGSGLVGIKLPANANYTTIKTGLFSGLANLEYVIIPENVTSISNNAFKNCPKLTSIELPSSITSIGNYAFEGSGLQSIVIPDSVTTIGTGIFNNCQSLVSVKLPENSTYNTIANNMFQNLSKLQHVDIPDTVTTIGYEVFNNCPKLETIYIPDSVTAMGSMVFAQCANLKNVHLPAGLETIDYRSFYQCISLEYIEIPNSVTLIKAQAFQECRSLRYVIIPDSVAEIKEYVFGDCNSLNSVIFGASSSLDKLEVGLFQNCTSLTSFVVPENCTYIRPHAFTGCTSLVYVKVPAKMKTIDSYAFINCVSLETVEGLDVYDSSVTTRNIYPEAFEFCASLYNINLSVPADKRLEIGAYAFNECKVLASLSLSVAEGAYLSVGAEAFKGTGIVTLNISGDGTVDIYTEAFANCLSLNYLGITDGSASPVLKVTCYDKAFEGCTSLSFFQNGCSDLYLRNRCFYGCKSLRMAYDNVGLPGIKEIGDYAFYSCWSLDSRFLALNGLTSVGNYAFADCRSLVSITLPNTLTSLGTYAFAYDNSLVSCTIPNNGNITTLPKGFLSGCRGLTSFDIPSSVTTIGDYAFSNAVSLTSIYIPDTVTDLGSMAFAYCSSLKSARLSENITEIKDFTFSQSGLESITLPASVKLIGTNAFGECLSLKTVTLLRTTKDLEIKYNAFVSVTLETVNSVLSETDYTSWSKDLIYIWDGSNSPFRADTHPDTTYNYGYVLSNP